MVTTQNVDAVLLQENKVPLEGRKKTARKLLQKGWVIFWGPARKCGYGEAILIHRYFSAGILTDCDDILSVVIRGHGGSLIRLANVYAPVQNHALVSQDEFFVQLQQWTELPGLWIAGGDFNYNLEQDTPIAQQCLTTRVGTWRRSATKAWGHNLDGFALPLSFLSGAQVHGLHEWSRTQHCPLLLTLEHDLEPAQHLSWHKPVVAYNPPCSDSCIQEFQQLLSSGNSDQAWSYWVELAFGVSLPVNPYRAASPLTCKNSKQQNDHLLAIMKQHRRVLAMGHRKGWDDDLYAQHEQCNSNISRLLDQGRKNALAHWRQTMTNLGAAARWVRDGLKTPAAVGADPLTPQQKGEQILNEWLPRWTQPLDEADRIAAIYHQVQPLPVEYDLRPWSNPDPCTPALIIHHCRNSAAGIDGLSFQHFASLHNCFLELLCEFFNALDNGLPLPSAWSSARLVCLAKPDGGTRPITILTTAYRIWSSRAAQSLADWTSWFPDALVGGRPGGPQAADSANHISSLLADHYARGDFLAGTCLDVSKCFDSISLEGVRILLRCIGAPEFLFQVVSLWQSIERHVWIDADPTGVVIQPTCPRGIPQGDPIAPWCLNLIMATWLCNLPPVHTVKVFLDDRCLLHNNLAELSLALQATYHFDWCFGVSRKQGQVVKVLCGAFAQ